MSDVTNGFTIKRYLGQYGRARLIFVWAIFLLFAAVSPALAQAPTEQLTAAQARQTALTRLRVQAEAGRAPLWHNAEPGVAVPLFDLDGAVAAYLFPVLSGAGQPAGYITVAAYQLPNPVLEFATAGDTPLDAAQSTPRALLAKMDTVHPLYLGLLTYGYAIPGTSSAPRQFFDLWSQKIYPVEPVSTTRQFRPATAPVTLPARVQTYNFISGVPDWNQFWGSYGCYSGCSPTSGINIMGYWDNHGYGNLIYGSDWQGAVNEMRGNMGTYCGGNTGLTNLGNIAPGIVTYAQNHGYTFGSDVWCPSNYGCSAVPTYARYLGEIDAGHPPVVDIIGHNTYGDHSVTGVGYDTNGSYMIVHDNWGSTATEVYLLYGSGYSEIFMHPVIPGGGAPQPTFTPQPTATATPQPSGQTKLYSLVNFGGSVVWQGGTGFSNSPNADSYSMELLSGWSIKTWSGDNRTGDYRCWTSSIANLQDHGWHLKIQSVEVYDYNVCPATATPQPTATPIPTATRTPTPPPTATPVPTATPTATPSSSPPALSAYQYTADDNNNGDSRGNSDGTINCGETIELYISIRNTGGETAQSPVATISTTDSYLNWIFNTASSYLDIPAGGYMSNSNDFDFTLSPDTPDGHPLIFDFDITAANGGPWHQSFYIPVTCNIPLQPSVPHEIGVTPSTITFGWDDRSANESGFNVYRWDGAVVDFVYLARTAANVHTYTDTELTCDAQQWYKITAFNTDGESAQTGWLEARTAACVNTTVYLPLVLK